MSFPVLCLVVLVGAFLLPFLFARRDIVDANRRYRAERAQLAGRGEAGTRKDRGPAIGSPSSSRPASCVRVIPR